MTVLKFPEPKHADILDWLKECAARFDALPAGDRPGLNGYGRAAREIEMLRTSVVSLTTKLQSKVAEIAGVLRSDEPYN